MKEPENMDNLLFFTNRSLNNGNITAWVCHPLCPQCKKGTMGKPVNPKTGKVIKKSEVYACHSCNHELPVQEAEGLAIVEIKYTCPFCKKSGEATTPYVRKSFLGVPAYIFTCKSCNEKIGITKKMKAPKKKGEVAIPE
ncbi:MAG: hypothetical protein ABIJ21_00090 [Nanoarchaeota archaeon]